MTLVDQTVARLQVVLHAEEDLYQRMRSLLRREESELVRLDANQLAETVEEKRAFAEEARLLEETRTVLTEEFRVALGLQGTDLKLGALVEQLGDGAEEFSLLLVRLKALIASTQALLESNESFSNRSLTRVQETLRMLGQAVPEEIGYGPGTSRSSSMGRGRLVRQTI